MTLRARIAVLNVIVVAALLLLAMLAWRMSGLQTDSQARQAELSQALAEAKHADMAHDALRANVMTALLVGIAPSLTQQNSAERVTSDSKALDDALGRVAATNLPAELTGRVEKVQDLAREYAASAAFVVKLAGEDQAAARGALPAFAEQFDVLKEELEGQAKELSAILDKAKLDAAAAAEAQRRLIGVICAFTVMLASTAAVVTTRSIQRRLTGLGRAAQAIADGDLQRRANDASPDEFGALAVAINRMAISLSGMIDDMRAETRRATFGHDLADALEMADREQHVSLVAARAMAEISPSHPMELLISDSSRAQMEQAAIHPSAGAPGCGVYSPYDCVAVRRGSMVAFEHSEALNACAHLCGRAGGPMAAVCVPVTFMGRAIGVLHATGTLGEALSTEQANQLGTLGAQLGVRLGTVRAFEKTQIQAATDSLTGIANRRSVEKYLGSMMASGKAFAILMCDLDHFKRLNDTYGHATGDAALRIFSDELRSTISGDDLAGRWGGEEFILVLAGCEAKNAFEVAQSLRADLAATLKLGETPAFTASFGIADSSMAGSVQDIIKLADEALYQAKESGRNQACIADPSQRRTDPVARRAQMNGAGIKADALIS